jgi:hypothetical protein
MSPPSTILDAATATAPAGAVGAPPAASDVPDIRRAVRAGARLALRARAFAAREVSVLLRAESGERLLVARHLAAESLRLVAAARRPLGTRHRPGARGIRTSEAFAGRAGAGASLARPTG